jgi:hypothetical protein
MTRTTIGLVVIGLVGSLGVAHGQEAAPAGARDPQSAVIGAWSLTKDLSDTGERLAGAMGGPGGGGRGGGMSGPGGGGMGAPGGGGGGGGRGGGMGGGFPGGGSSGGGMSGPGGSGGRAREAGPAFAALKAQNKLTIVPADGAVAITTGDGVSRRYVTDGKKYEYLTGDGVVKYTAKWNGATLSVDTEFEKGPKIAWMFVPVDIGAQLLVIVRVSGGDMPGNVLAHQIYRRDQM